MSVNSQSPFVSDDNNPGSIADDQGLAGYQDVMGSPFFADRNDNQIAPTGAMSGISHPDNSSEGQVSEPRHVSFAQDGGLEYNPYMRPQIGAERLHSYTPTPTFDNSTTQNSFRAAYPHNQNSQPRQKRGTGHGPFSTPSPYDMGGLSRTGRGALPHRLSNSNMGVSSLGVGFDNLSTGSGDMVLYNAQAPTSKQSFGNGRAGSTNTAQASVGSKSRRSPSNIAQPQYDNQHGYASGQHLGTQFGNSLNMNPTLGQPNNISQQQAESEGWTRDQIYQYDDALSSGYAHGQSPVLGNYGADAPNGSEMGENSDSTVSSQTVQGTESLAGDDRMSRSEMRGRGSEPMSSSQFKGHSDRAAHRAGGPLQKVKSLGRRSKGAADPTNTEIVHWYDNHEMSFADIARRLNSRQEMKGLPGKFTPNSIHNRYNRCAPIIYRAHGREFVAIKDRRKRAPEELDAMCNGFPSIEWTPGKDQFLRSTVEEYEANKWLRVAEAVAAATGERVSAHTVATRFGMIV